MSQPPPMTAREYQKLLCPACGQRKDPAQELCAACRLRQQSRPDPCPQCGQPKPAHYELCDRCQVGKLMACPYCGQHKGHPERRMCPSCYAERKHGTKVPCECPCQCGKFKTKPKAPVCGICWQAGHFYNPPEPPGPRESENDFAPI